MTGTSGNKEDYIEPHILRRYEIQQKLGKGAYGIVWKAIDKKTKEVVALKKIFDAFQNDTDAQRTYREVEYLKLMAGHENIIRLYQVYRAANDRDLYLVFEFMETDLHAVIRANILEEIHKQYIIWQLLKSLKFMHSSEILHRDMKPANLLLNTECQVKVADFGLARSLKSLNRPDGTVGALTDYVATRWYRAPEILLGSTYYTKGVDMWSIGCILGELILGKPIFPGRSTIQQLEKIVEVTGVPTKEDIESMKSNYAGSFFETLTKVKRVPLEVMFPNASPEARDLLSKLLVFNPNKRLTAVQSLNHPYVAQFHDVSQEPECPFICNLGVDDNIKLSLEEYRELIYADSKKQRDKRKTQSGAPTPVSTKEKR
eukprot:TRINITY_DN8513_c0_g1::TRINITY_DN8513_c0_g1_i1::g.3376::m.3376 TRINITY_DN8513_c0_g1::TRINITY_DN8513_c0_g1_i1::g.3376  ORF type:complete len:373 (-),score=46.77,sp/Q54QB1/ERK2_DICDI/62.05/3e-152,Pkinase/PF00069.20/1.5e-73,Pkinase_Tyr/PF07714.12/2.5e-32,Kinase-like/PF14531.1/8e+02,Kinase-like/PF14531.1/0.0021,APH/PF01636.18/28,APH/PF01636.18/0.41 TRINITY_DN8513_c0_g1_i1:142-1260(-)